MISTAHHVDTAREATSLLGVDPPSRTMTAIGMRSLRGIAAAYDDLPNFDDYALPAWDALAEETRNQWSILRRTLGFTLSVEDTDPYASVAELFDDVNQRVIRVLSTESTGGHPYWSDETNDLFRAVHDVFGHAATGRGFDRHGEARAYAHHRLTFSPLARQALATELRGQAAALIIAGDFVPQKIAIMPRFFREQPFASTAALDLADAHLRHLQGGLRTVRS